MSYDWVFFDADGTLFDYDLGQAAALEGAFEACGLSYTPEIGPLYSGINIEIWRDFELGAISQEKLKTARFDRLFDAVGLTADSEEFSGHYLAILGAQTALLDGAEELVRALTGKAGMLLITNGLAEVQVPRFASSPIRDCFAEIVISGEIGLAKPDPAIFDFAFERIGHPAKERVLMIGDNLGSDILGGANYGLDTCWYNPSGTLNGHGVEPTYEIRELQSILGIVEGCHESL